MIHNNKRAIFFLSLLGFIFMVSLLIFLVSVQEKRFVVFFESYDEPGLFTEVRMIKKEKTLDYLNFYLEELLLGPINIRYKAIFPKDSSLISYVLRDNLLYITVRSENAKIKELDTDKIHTLALKNISRNFKYIKDLRIFINGFEI